MIFNEYIINNEVIFNVNMNELQPVGDNGESVTLNAPTARCLQLLLESNGKIISREEFLDSVWKTRGVVVSHYRKILLLQSDSAGLSSRQDQILPHSYARKKRHRKILKMCRLPQAPLRLRLRKM